MDRTQEGWETRGRALMACRGQPAAASLPPCAASLAGSPLASSCKAAVCQELKEEQQTAEGKESCSLTQARQIRAKPSPLTANKFS